MLNNTVKFLCSMSCHFQYVKVIFCLFFKFRLGGRSQDGSSTVSRIGSRLNKIKGALKSQPVMEGQAYNIDSHLDLETDSEFVSTDLSFP